MVSPGVVILAVDDEVSMLRLLRAGLGSEGFRVVTATNADDALRLAEEQRPDLVLLDIELRGTDGLEVMRQLRERVNTPIILLTGRDKVQDRVAGLDLGADDYVTKPFSMDELIARIRTVLRRSLLAPRTDRVVRVGSLEVDLGNNLLRRDGILVKLTRTEWRILEVLAAHANRAATYAELLSAVWGSDHNVDIPYLRIWISRLRNRLEPDPSHPALIRTAPGVGYMLVTEPPPKIEL